MADKSLIIAALRQWIAQRPGLEFGNYGELSSYRAEMRSITKDMHHARAMLDYVAWHDSITVERILDACRPGRLSINIDGDKVSIDYCVGQYWPTEYRAAVCRIMARVIWSWLWENMPAGELMHNSETGETLERYDGLRAGDYIRKAVRRELGASIQKRWLS